MGLTREYSIEQVHRPKGARRSGKTVDVCMAAIQSLMVTDNETIYIVVPFLDRIRNIEPELFSVCRYHFKESLQLIRQGEYQIKGHNGRIRICSHLEWEEREWANARIQALYDN